MGATAGTSATSDGAATADAEGAPASRGFDPSGNDVPASNADPSDIPAMTKWWRQRAHCKVSEVIRLVSDSGKSEVALATILQNTALGTATGDMTGHCLVHYDANLSGESVTAARVWAAPFRREHLQRLVGAFQQVRKTDNDAKISKGEVYVLHDAGKNLGDAFNKFFIIGKGRFNTIAKSEGVGKFVTNVLFKEDGFTTQ